MYLLLSTSGSYLATIYFYLSVSTYTHFAVFIFLFQSYFYYGLLSISNSSVCLPILSSRLAFSYSVRILFLFRSCFYSSFLSYFQSSIPLSIFSYLICFLLHSRLKYLSRLSVATLPLFASFISLFHYTICTSTTIVYTILNVLSILSYLLSLLLSSVHALFSVAVSQFSTCIFRLSVLTFPHFAAFVFLFQSVLYYSL